MQTKIHKWGNSLAVRIPKTMAQDINLADGSEVQLDVRGGLLTIRPLKRYDLSEMLAAITDENIHDEIHAGEPLGLEEL